jgi:hypothetical protein
VLTIRCNEAWADYDPAHLAGAGSFEYHYDLENAEWWQEVCAMVPKAGAAAGSEVLRPSPVPVLALNGEEDPRTRRPLWQEPRRCGRTASNWRCPTRATTSTRSCQGRV